MGLELHVMFNCYLLVGVQQSEEATQQVLQTVQAQIHKVKEYEQGHTPVGGRGNRVDSVCSVNWTNLEQVVQGLCEGAKGKHITTLNKLLEEYVTVVTLQIERCVSQKNLRCVQPWQCT